MTAEELLGGPRGRGLCLAVALSLSEQVGGAWDADDEHLAQVLHDLDPTPVAAWADPPAFMEPLDQSVSSAMYWQQPHREDVAAADPGVLAALRPTAEAVVRSPAAAWWDTALDLTTMRCTSRYDCDDERVPPRTVV